MAKTCGNQTEWILKPKGNNLRLQIKSFPKEIPSVLRKLVFKSTTSERLQRILLTATQPVIISLMATENNQNDMNVEIFYEWFADAQIDKISNLSSLNQQSCNFLCHLDYLTIIIVFLIPIFIGLPPFVCAMVIKKTMVKKRRKNELLNSKPRNECHSSDTLEGNKYSSSNETNDEPLIGLNEMRKMMTVDSTSTKAIANEKFQKILPNLTSGRSSFSFQTDHDLEYDYYEPTIVGSFFNQTSFYSIMNFQQTIENLK
ncbi:unnamed protein product [Dracunculus medinensis]|uniref:Uncharacterized protein n=1 Tax=Dracunculus medinensis TaxID=318479 RepID=A0A3P7QQP1_DRAME|nr:unnamed protein product [Dracunculus medinensis]